MPVLVLEPQHLNFLLSHTTPQFSTAKDIASSINDTVSLIITRRTIYIDIDQLLCVGIDASLW